MAQQKEPDRKITVETLSPMAGSSLIIDIRTLRTFLITVWVENVIESPILHCISLLRRLGLCFSLRGSAQVYVKPSAYMINPVSRNPLYISAI
jgi:hypothetical protein